MQKSLLSTGSVALATVILFGATAHLIAGQNNMWYDEMQRQMDQADARAAQEQRMRDIAGQEADQVRRGSDAKESEAQQRTIASHALLLDAAEVLVVAIICALLVFLGYQAIVFTRKRGKEVSRKASESSPLRSEFPDEPPPFPTSSRMNRTLQCQSPDEPPPFPPNFRGNKMSGTGHR